MVTIEIEWMATWSKKRRTLEAYDYLLSINIYSILFYIFILYIETFLTYVYHYLRFYFFGCLSVTADGNFTFQDAPEGTWIQGYSEKEEFDDYWLEMKDKHCEGEGKIFATYLHSILS